MGRPGAPSRVSSRIRPLEPPWPNSPVSTRSSPSPATAGSSSRRVRSTAVRVRPGTTGPSAPSSRRTSAGSGGRRSCAAAATWSASTPRSSCPSACWEASGHVATFTDPLVECLQLPQALPRRQPHRGLRGAQGPQGRERPRRRALPELRHQGPVHRAQVVLGPREDLPRRRRRRVGPALPAPRDRAGHLRELHERPHREPQEAAVRHRPGRQGVPQRDHPRQLHLPHPRVRADGDRVTSRRPPRHRSGSSTGSRPAGTGSSISASTPTTCAASTCPRRTARTTRPAPSTSSTASASRARSGASSWASRTAPTTTCPATARHPVRASRTSTRPRASATPRT